MPDPPDPSLPMVAALVEQAASKLVPPLELIDVVSLLGESLAAMYGYRQLRPRAKARPAPGDDDQSGARSRTKDTPLSLEALLRHNIVGVKMVVLAHPPIAAAAGYVHFASFPLTHEQQMDWAEQRYIQWRLDVYGPAMESEPTNPRDLDFGTRSGMINFQRREIKKHSFLQMDPKGYVEAIRRANALHGGGKYEDEPGDPKLAAAYLRMLEQADVSFEDLLGISGKGKLVMQPRALRKAFDQALCKGVSERDGRALSLKAQDPDDDEDSGRGDGIELQGGPPPADLALLREARDARDGLAGHPLLLRAWDDAAATSDHATTLQATEFLMRLRDTLDRQRDPALRAATVYLAFRPKADEHGYLTREEAAAAYGVSVKRLRGREDAARAALGSLAA